MSCICDCGEAFDLQKGLASKKYGRNVTVCPICHQKETQREDLEYQIFLLTNQEGKKREVKKLKLRLEELGGKLNDY